MTTTPSDGEEKATDGGKRSSGGRRGQAVLIVAAVAAAFHLYGAGSLADLAGGTVSVGPPGSGTEQMSRQILEAYGMTYDDVTPRYLSFNESATALILPMEADRVDFLSEKYPYVVHVLAEDRDALAQVHAMVRQIDMASLLESPISLHAVTQAWVDANLTGGGRSR